MQVMRRSRLKSLLATAEDHISAGRLNRAVASYRKVLRFARAGEFEHELAHVRLGDIHLGLGQADRAIPHLRRARRIDADEPEYALMLGRALLAYDRPQEASVHLMDATTSLRLAAEAFAEMARAAFELGDRATAGKLARKAVELDPDEVEYHGLSRLYADA
jgi:predicted Zn-dependent protease